MGATISRGRQGRPPLVTKHGSVAAPFPTQSLSQPLSLSLLCPPGPPFPLPGCEPSGRDPRLRSTVPAPLLRGLPSFGIHPQDTHPPPLVDSPHNSLPRQEGQPQCRRTGREPKAGTTPATALALPTTRDAREITTSKTDHVCICICGGKGTAPGQWPPLPYSCSVAILVLASSDTSRREGVCARPPSTHPSTCMYKYSFEVLWVFPQRGGRSVWEVASGRAAEAHP